MNSTEAADIPTYSSDNNSYRDSTSPSPPASTPSSGISTQNVLLCMIIALSFLLSFIFGVKIRRSYITRPGSSRQTQQGHLESAPNIGTRLDKITIDLLMPAFMYNSNSKLVIGGQGMNIILKESDEEEGRFNDDNEEVRDDQCAVCLCKLKNGEEVRMVPKCEHRFHTGCIDMWFHSHSTCPLCRTPVLEP